MCTACRGGAGNREWEERIVLNSIKFLSILSQRVRSYGLGRKLPLQQARPYSETSFGLLKTLLLKIRIIYDV